jgi:hypothetical protein
VGALKVPRAVQVLQDQQDPQELLDLKALQEMMDPQDLKDL